MTIRNPVEWSAELMTRTAQALRSAGHAFQHIDRAAAATTSKVWRTSPLRADFFCTFIAFSSGRKMTARLTKASVHQFSNRQQPIR
jgi:hypothetical protein